MLARFAEEESSAEAQQAIPDDGTGEARQSIPDDGTGVLVHLDKAAAVAGSQVAVPVTFYSPDGSLPTVLYITPRALILTHWLIQAADDDQPAGPG
jgi:hypothetical protein